MQTLIFHHNSLAALDVHQRRYWARGVMPRRAMIAPIETFDFFIPVLAFLQMVFALRAQLSLNPGINIKMLRVKSIVPLF